MNLPLREINFRSRILRFLSAKFDRKSAKTRTLCRRLIKHTYETPYMSSLIDFSACKEIRARRCGNKKAEPGSIFEFVNYEPAAAGKRNKFKFGSIFGLVNYEPAAAGRIIRVAQSICSTYKPSGFSRSA